jgi:hypothetical protein
MAEDRFAGDVMAVRRARRRLSAICARAAVACAVGPIVVALVASLLGRWGVHALDDLALSAWMFGWLLGTPACTVAALVTGVRRLQPTTRLTVDEAHLILHGPGRARVIPRAEVRGAIHVARPLGAEPSYDTEIMLAGGDLLHVALLREEDAAALLGALGFGARARRTAVPLGDDHDALAAGCWGVLLAVIATTVSTCGLAVLSSSTLLHHAAGYILGAIFVGTSLLFARLLTSRRVIIGTDGVLVEGAFGNTFIPLASITRVDWTARGLDVVTAGAGGQPRVHQLTSGRSDRAHALRERILEAMAANRPTGAEGSALVARGGRALPEWREALRRLVRGGGYRGESVSLETLLRTVESADAPAEQRIGAALALGMAEDGPAKQRLRVAVEGIADETMRAALEEAAAGAEDEAAIAEALEAERAAAAQR